MLSVFVLFECDKGIYLWLSHIKSYSCYRACLDPIRAVVVVSPAQNGELFSPDNMYLYN